MAAEDSLTRAWAIGELARRAQRAADAFDVTPGADPLVTLREVTRTMLLDHIVAQLLLTVVSDAEFNRIREDLRAAIT